MSHERNRPRVRHWEWLTIAVALPALAYVTNDKGIWHADKTVAADGSTSISFTTGPKPNPDAQPLVLNEFDLKGRLRLAAEAYPWCASTIELAFEEQKYGVCADETKIALAPEDMTKVLVGMRSDPDSTSESGPGLYRTFRDLPEECLAAKEEITLSFRESVAQELGNDIANQLTLDIMVAPGHPLDSCGEL